MANFSYPQTQFNQNLAVTIGPAGSGASYVTDGTADDVQFQAAIDAVEATGGGLIEVIQGTYSFTSMVTRGKNPKTLIKGLYSAKSAYNGVKIQADAAIDAIFKEVGDTASTSNADLTHTSAYENLILDANANATACILAHNVDHLFLTGCAFLGKTYCIDFTYAGDPSAADYAGGVFMDNCRFNANSGTSNIRVDTCTQMFFVSNWFLGTPTQHLEIISSNKIHLSNNEFNTVGTSGSIIKLTDSGADTAFLHCGDIDINGGFMDTGNASYDFINDTRTDTASKGVVMCGVRLVQGNMPLLTNQAKDFNSVTHTTGTLNLVSGDSGYDQVVLNASGNITIKMPDAASATKPISFKNIADSTPQTITIDRIGSDTVELTGTNLGTQFTFRGSSLANRGDSVTFFPDGDKWRIRNLYLP